MRQAVRFVVVIAVFLLSAIGIRADEPEIRIVPYDPLTMSYPISPEQATASVRAWLGDSQLQLTLTGVEQEEGWTEYDEYVLESSAHRFKVRCSDGHVRSYRDRQAVTSWTQAVNSGLTPSLSKAEMEQVATAFAATHYPGYGSRSMRLIEMDEGTATFAEELPGGALFSGNMCKVSVCEFTGRVKEYLAHRADQITISTIPGVTSGQAEAAALEFLLGGPGVQSAITVVPSVLWLIPDDLGAQRLLWSVEAATGPDPNMTYALWQTDEWRFDRQNVFVDAQSGEVFEAVPSLGSARPTRASQGWVPRSGSAAMRRQPRAASDRGGLMLQSRNVRSPMYPPIVYCGCGYVYAGYLRNSRWNARVTWRNRALEVTTADGRVFTLRPRGSAGSPIVVRSGRAYVAPRVWEQVTGRKCTYSPVTHTVSLGPPPFHRTSSADAGP